MSAVMLHVTCTIWKSSEISVSPSLQDAVALVNELKGILKDTSIAFGCDQFMWQNGGPQRCGTGQSSVQATDEDKRPVRIVENLLAKDASRK
ncbi:hypothetical protein ACG7TL_001138 [Trametes sanguinea]